MSKIASPTPGVSRLLSILIMGRDDDYMLDFKYRITTTINYIARNLKRLGRLDDVEILVTDWGSEVPLAQTLPLSSEAAQICRFVYVPPAVIRAVQGGEDSFHVTLATNTGLRRACGKFLMPFAADLLLPQHSLEAILRLLGGELRVPIDVDHTYFLVHRYQVPWQFVQRQPDLDEWDRYLLLNSGDLVRVRWVLLSISSGTGALMMHWSLWHKLRGLDERLGGWGWNDIEAGLRVTQCYPWVELSSIGVSLFHMEHSPYGGRASSLKQQKANPHVHNPMFQINDENWGLGDYELEIQIPQNIGASEEPTKSFTLPRESNPQEVESWYQSRQEVIVELASEEVRDHVRRIVELFLRERKWNIDFEGIDSLFLLSWYSRYRYPRRYLEFGIRRGYAAAVVASACPSVEIYGIDRWEGILRRHTPLAVAGILRRGVDHNGYTRFINGDISTGVQRLRDSFVGSFFFDLVLVRGDLFEADAIKQVAQLLTDLAPGGALVLTCGSTDHFRSLWNEVKSCFPQFSYFQCKGRKTGMILAASLRHDRRGGAVDEDCLFRTDLVWADISHNRRVQQLRRVCNALKKPTRYTEYAKRICRLALGYLSGRGSH